MKTSKRIRRGTAEEIKPLENITNDGTWNKGLMMMAPPPPSVQHANNFQHQMMNENYFRSDVSGPLNFYNAEQSKSTGHLLAININNYQMKPPQAYPISYQSENPTNIDKFSKNNQTSLGQDQHTSAAVSSYLTQLYQNKPQQNNSNFMPKQGYYTSELPGNVAPTSSYYTLTPASSTTSLNDFALLNSTNLDITQRTEKIKKSTLGRTDSKKRGRTSTFENTEETGSKTANSKKINGAAKAPNNGTTAEIGTAVAAVPKRRGRPPKNLQSVQSASQLSVTNKDTEIKPKLESSQPITSEVHNNVKKVAISGLTRSNSNIDSTTASKYNTKSNKLIKSLINKSSSNSNLQKSKVQTQSTLAKNTDKDNTVLTTNENKQPISVTVPVNNGVNNGVTNPLVNKSNLLLDNQINVNNNNVSTQSHITGYLVDKNVNTNYDNVNKSLNTQECNALKVAGVNMVKPSNISNNNQLNTVNSSIYTGYYNKVKSIRSSSDLNITTEEFNNNKNKSIIYQEPVEIVSSTPMPKLSWANNHELWETMRKKDAKYTHDTFYLKRHSNIEPQMRAILIDWLVEISYAYRLHRETFHLALEYMDRFMTCCKQQMRVDRLQLIGMTCLFLAAKVEEIYPPKLKELASHMENYSNNNEDAISQFELFILKTLNWEISPVTANTWLMTYIQIASINYYSLTQGTPAQQDQPLNSHMVMPLNIYKNSNVNKLNATTQQQQFYQKNYMKSVTLLDLCMFEMESMKFSYSILAASAMYHMVSLNNSQNPQDNYTTPINQQGNSQQLAGRIIEMSTGYKLYELDACIKWMYPFADVCKDILTEEKMCFVKSFSSVEQEDSHNIQLYHQNIELLKEAQSRKTPCKFYSNPNQSSNPVIPLTPPDSHRKFQQSESFNTSTTVAYKN